MSRLLVLGARSPIGDFLLPRLRKATIDTLALTRGVPPHDSVLEPQVLWKQFAPDTLVATLRREGRFDCAVCLAPLPTLIPHLAVLVDIGVNRLIAFSTTGSFYKANSNDRIERTRIAEILAAEQSVVHACSAHQIGWTLFRPTMVYGSGRDRNVAQIARFVRRFGFFPIVADARGLRQPVHADDLATACVEVLRNQATYDKAYTLSGGGVIAYRQMVEAVFRQLGRPVRIVSVPLDALRLGIAAARFVPGLRALSPEMADRMLVDLCFDHDMAAVDFAFRPRPFQLDNQAVGLG